MFGELLGQAGHVQNCCFLWCGLNLSVLVWLREGSETDKLCCKVYYSSNTLLCVPSVQNTGFWGLSFQTNEAD